MSSRRVLKAASSIREVVSMAILTEIKDPRVKNVTVTGVEVAPDMRTAKVCVSVMGDDTTRRLSLHGLQNSAGFLQSLIAKRLDTRYTPRLTFTHDDGVQKSAAVARILNDWRRESESKEATEEPSDDTVGGEAIDGESIDENPPLETKTAHGD